MELWNEIQTDLALLMRSVEELRKRGEERAKADADYRALKAAAILEEKAKGTSATLCRDVIYKREDVQIALMRRDCAEALYESCQEGINALKLKIRVYESQHEREWNQAKRSM